MTYKEKIEDFVNLLNMFAKDTMLFPETFGEGLFSLEFVERDDMLSLILMFEDKSGKHCVYRKSLQVHGDALIDEEKKNSFYIQSYLEIMRFALFGIDCIGKLVDNNGNPLNIITFSTLVGKGLKVLNQ